MPFTLRTFFALQLLLSDAAFAARTAVELEPSAPIETHRWYEVLRRAEIEALAAYDDQLRPLQDFGRTLLLDQTNDLMVLHDDGVSAIIDLGEDVEGLGPNIFRVRSSDVHDLWLRPIDFELLLNSLGDEVASRDLLETKEARRGGGRGRSRRGRGRMTYCAREVRVHLRLSDEFRVECASQGYSVYTANGFRPIGTAWEGSAPGTVCFFGGGRGDCSCGRCGHMAVKLPNGMWKGAGVRQYPYPNRNWSRNYTFQGCAVR